jgi:hypothetical protein
MNGFIKVLSRSAIALAILKLSIGLAAAMPSAKFYSFETQPSFQADWRRHHRVWRSPSRHVRHGKYGRVAGPLR